MAGVQPASATSSSSGQHASSNAHSSSSGGSRSSRATSRSNSSRCPGGSSRPVAAQDDTAAQISETWAEALLVLCRVLPLLLELSHACLFYSTNRSYTAARHNPLVGMEQYGIISNPEYADGNWDRLNSQEQASLSVLCSALHDTLPQLASMAEAALRTCPGCDNALNRDLPRQAGIASSRSLRFVHMSGLLVAAGLQRPGSPALKPLCGLA
jgi:hypothetical protein